MSKPCSQCKMNFPSTQEYFYRDKRAMDKLYSLCKICCGKIVAKHNRTEKGKITRKRADKKRAHSPHRKAQCLKIAKKYYSTISGHLSYVYSRSKRRCNNPTDKDYKNYGGRGIKSKFKSLNVFRDYVIKELQIDPRGLQIDRIDNNGHYEPGNIRFVTSKVNNNNRRNNIKHGI